MQKNILLCFKTKQNYNYDLFTVCKYVHTYAQINTENGTFNVLLSHSTLTIHDIIR